MTIRLLPTLCLCVSVATLTGCTTQKKTTQQADHYGVAIVTTGSGPVQFAVTTATNNVWQLSGQTNSGVMATYFYSNTNGTPLSSAGSAGGIRPITLNFSQPIKLTIQNQ